ncbi:MAG: hypothetical protein ACRYG8_33270 [Janthinobacterium lividum]
MQNIENLLGETLEEEKRADQRLSAVAETLVASGKDEEPESDEDKEKENQEAETKLKSKSKKS